MRRMFFCFLTLLLAVPACADSGETARNRISFQVEAVREIANDWATARLSVVAEGKDAAEVAGRVNRLMATALETANHANDIEVESGAYVTQPVYDDGRVVRWRARQELRAESGDVERLAELIGTLQGESLLLSNMHFSVKTETQKALEDELIEEALAEFRSRANRITTGMGGKSWALIALSVGQSGRQPRMMSMRADSNMMSAAKAPPAAFEAGTSEIRIQVSGEIELD